MHETTGSKFVISFSLVEGGKQRLQRFMDKNFVLLQQEDEGAMNALRNVLWEVLPVECRDDLKKVLMGHADFVVEIHNFPEIPQLEMRKHPKADGSDTYARFFGEALYSLFASESVAIGMLPRRKNRDDGVGDAAESHILHRDFLKGGHHVIFATGYNGEHALTEFVRLRKVLDALPKEYAEKLHFSITTFSQRSVQQVTLGELTALVRNEAADPRAPRLRSLELLGDKAAPEVRMCSEMLGAYSAKLNIQPGTLVVLCEDGVYHCGHPALAEQLASVPDEAVHSRMIYHHTGRSMHPAFGND